MDVSGVMILYFSRPGFRERGGGGGGCTREGPNPYFDLGMDEDVARYNHHNIIMAFSVISPEEESCIHSNINFLSIEI